MIRRIIIYFVIFLLSFYLLNQGMSKVYVFLIALGLVGLILIFPFYYMLLVETRIDRLEKFLKKQHNNPELYLSYLMVNNRFEETEALLERMLIKHKNPSRQALYKAMYAAHQKNTVELKNILPDIQLERYRNYYEAYVLMDEGHLERARSLITATTKPWMRDSLLSEIELKAGNRQEAISYARQALLGCKGVQRYMTYKNYERYLPEALTNT